MFDEMEMGFFQEMCQGEVKTDAWDPNIKCGETGNL